MAILNRAARAGDASRRAWHRVPEMLVVNVATALGSLRQNVLRSSLTILGVVIGVASVIALVALATGAQQELTAQIDSLGANVAMVDSSKLPGQSNYNPVASAAMSTLTDADVAHLREVPGVIAVAPLSFVGGAVYRGDQPATICLPIATTPEYPLVRRIDVETGRFFTAEEMNDPVCLIGVAIRDDLFPNENPVGQTISVDGVEYGILGVVKQRSLSDSLLGGKELDAILYLPLDFVRSHGQTSERVSRIFVGVDPYRPAETTLEAIRSSLMSRHEGRDDFSVLTSKELLDMFNKVFRVLAALLVGVTGISLLVGGIGIMNIMLVSVTERTREIGIRKTVGARRTDIFVQFLTEAICLSVMGGILGVALAVVACIATSIYSPLHPVITAMAVAEGVGVCVGVGVIFGVLPAAQAARKSPIDAMRYE